MRSPAPMPDPIQVRSMFGRIAGRYDLLNRLLSAGIDQRWRRAAVRRAGELGRGRVLDACCGTGDLALAFERAGGRVVGVDFTPQMLTLAERKRRADAGGPLFVHGDALRLPAGNDSVDLATVAFGIRNVADRGAALVELARVVRPGGMALVLEFSMPPGAVLGFVYRFYFTRILPVAGRLISRDRGAYDYLPRTVLAWPRPDELQREFEAAGFEACGHRPLTRGIACLHWGRVPAPADSGRPPRPR